MQRHGHKRSRPETLHKGTQRVISVRMNYLPPDADNPSRVLSQSELAYVSRYAVGRDYHKLMRKRLQQLVDKINHEIGRMSKNTKQRVFVDSAPVLEKALAEKSGLGWIGKHSNLINRKAGSWFFLGEIYTDLPLPTNQTLADNHCGSCQACIDICPTQAIVGPYEVDARRCISYLTIELKGAIPVEFRSMMGNRIYGCDDCQLVCPWNRFARHTEEKDFRVRHGLDKPDLLTLFNWTEETFLQRTEGSAIRRIGYHRWLRNIAVALGNAPKSARIINALEKKRQFPSELVKEHVTWALLQQEKNA